MRNSCYIDANLLIYLHNPESEFHEQTIAIFEKLAIKNYKIVISSLDLDEYLFNIMKLFAGTHTQKLKKLKFSLRKILTTHNITLINPSLTAKKHLLLSG